MSQFAQRVKKQSQLNFLKFLILLVQVHNQLTRDRGFNVVFPTYV